MLVRSSGRLEYTMQVNKQHALVDYVSVCLMVKSADCISPLSQEHEGLK